MNLKVEPSADIRFGVEVGRQYAATYVVEDARGDRFQMYEFRGTRFFRRGRIFELESGAPVKRVDFDTYELGTTGERLVRVSR